MTPQRYQRAREIFHQVCELAPAEQLEHLRQCCGNDAELHEEVLSLLGHNNEPQDLFRDDGLGFGRALLDESSESDGGSQKKVEHLPNTIGDYLIIRKLGEGGMGVVYEAEQQQPQRRVALKVLRPGFTTQNILRRFAQESELLGRFQHPCIAHVYEAGNASTPFGEQPYFAMELVRGKPLNEYATRLGLSVRERMSLFVQVCDAVHHAHTRGIIHRDLKPANILVVDKSEQQEYQQRKKTIGATDLKKPQNNSIDDKSESPEPATIKVLDFGIARATDADMKISTIQTDIGQLIGTVPYMSPEQVKGDPTQLDARSDVYSLGVVLYELLAERLPYELANHSIPEAARMIQEYDPTRLSSINRIFRGDVDTIVGKALEKEKSRRYQSADEFARDIRRFLADEPVLARPASTLYQLRKFARRNRALVGGVSVGALAIMVGLVVAISQAVRATNAKNAAEEREQMRLYQTYLAGITSGASALENHDVALARRSLEMVPDSLRGWEWNHLVGRLDESLVVINTPDAIRGASPWFMRDLSNLSVVLAKTSGIGAWDATSGSSLGVRAPPGALFATDHRGLADAVWTHDQLKVRRPGENWNRTTKELGLSNENFARMAISDGGRFIALIGRDKSARIDSNTGNVATVNINDEGTGINALAVTKNGDVLLASAIEGRPAIWNPESGLSPIENVPTFARSIDVSPNNKFVVLGLQDTTIQLIDLVSRSISAIGRGHMHAVTGVAFSGDGDRVASVSLDRTLRLWDSSTLSPLATLHGHDRGIWGVAFSDDGSLLATTGEDRTIRIWNANQRLSGRAMVGHEGFVYSVAFSPDGWRLASAGWDQTIRIWNTEACNEIEKLSIAETVISSLNYSHDGRFLTWIGNEKYGAFDLTTKKVIFPESLPAKPRALTVKCFDFIEGTNVVPLPWTLNDRGMVVWNVETNQSEIWSADEFKNHDAAFLAENGRYAVGISSGNNTPDVRTALMDSGSSLLIMDLVGGKEVPLPKFSGPFALSSLPNAPALLAARPANDVTHVEVWNLDGPRRVGELVGHTDNIYAIAYSPDGKRIATAGRDSLRLWDADTLKEIVQLRGHTSFVWALEFSSDGSQLASGSGDQTVRIWSSKPSK